MPVSNSVANCTDLADKLFNCLTPKHQAGYYYREGEYDTCGLQMRNMKLCMKAKLLSDEDEAKKVVAKYELFDGSKLENSPTKGLVWSFKDKPGWD
tara:strand:- start:37 stop:324 length:288 start_codon:yes stop_codon:yes gene_type:complete